MTTQSAWLSKEDLLRQINEGWQELNARLMRFTSDQFTGPTDDNGWTAKDHTLHLAAWEKGVVGVLEGRILREAMELSEDVWNSPDFNIPNEVLRQRTLSMSLDEGYAFVEKTHQDLLDALEKWSEEDLNRPMKDFQPDRGMSPLYEFILGCTSKHYEEQLPWIEAIAEKEKFTKDQLLNKIQNHWADFRSFIGSLSEAQLTQPKDADGWAVKDHIAHLYVWEAGMNAVLEGQSRHETMGLPQDIWERHENDEINEVIRQKHADKTADEVLAMFDAGHERLVKNLEGWTDEKLQAPFNQYDKSASDRPIILYFGGNTFEHYDEHRPWIEAILNG